MIFFRKKKTAPSPPTPPKKEVASPKEKSFQDIIHSRVLTAEGWRRLIEKKHLKKK